ncbi:HD domain-containing phosphohydrolase [Sulfurimonas sp.]|jgi:HD-GYP domain-containing protein (c-di-GMP phosphodiesterase class II)/ribonuclease BN (tRNA processing enzyme)|uniref:HD domain-containing phosphohydrolase n=1 Tax=Sulfurimonas sp. TaxID=2022749 RepID=UPI0025F15A82|nr:HD domain-containing phosphohydrolase [Sulfurimonas sp.]MBT5934627.1 HD domain-containing protein [Sulfurimonas sp.]
MKNVKSLGANEILELVFIYLTDVSSLRAHDEIISVLANMGKALTSSDRCTVWVVSDDKKTIWTKVAHGIEHLEIPIYSGIVGSSIKNKKKIIIDNVYEDDRFNPEIDKQTGYATKSMLVIPMFGHDEEIIGAFQVMNNQSNKGNFDNRDMQRLMLASTYAAETLIAMKLSQEVEETQREVVFTMGAVAESRSKETGNHVRRVAEYSKILALAYGLSAEEAELLKQASPMHDIGKVAIPDSILNKPGRFNAQERRVMDTHAELGYSMIKNSQRPLLKAAAIVAYEHHEKWDGSGYPNKKSGEDIHIYGRITAIADVYDALGSDRVYKKAWTPERILELFKEQRAKHFDPKLTDLFFENLDKIYEVRDEFKDEYKEVELEEDTSESISILGAYGTKAKGFGTSSFALDKINVIDAGNLLEALDEECSFIENIWITHSHLDHIADIAYILDNYFSLRTKTLNIIGLPETIETIRKHYLNNLIWPDFSKIALDNSSEMALKYTIIEIGKEYPLDDTSSIKAFPTDHTVDSCGYIYKKNSTAVIITADTYSLSSLIAEVEDDKSINSMVIECSFPSEMESLAIVSKHLTPKILFEKLKKLKRDDIDLYINHIKPMFLFKIIAEIEEYKGKWEPIILKDGDFIKF